MGARPAQGGGTGGGIAAMLREGPVGAGGSRPMLASTWAGVAARRPAAVQPASGLGPAGGSQATPLGRKSPVVDADGFQLVGRAAPQGAAKGAAAASAATDAAATNADVAIPQPVTPRADGDGDDVVMGDGGGMQAPPRADGGGGDDDEDPAATDDGPTEQELHDQMQLDQRLLAWVKAQGLDEGHPRREQAERQAAESKRAWQETRPRATPSSRMRWAEEALLKARKGAARMEQAIDELDTWYEEEREARQESLREWRDKVKMREEKLAEITREAAENYTPEAAADHKTELLQGAFQSLGQSIGPALEQLREAAADGSEMQQRINATLSAVFDLYGTIGSVVSTDYQQAYHGQPQPPQQQQQRDCQQQQWGAATGVATYDIGDGWGYGGGGGGWYGGYDGWAGGGAHDGWGWYDDGGNQREPAADADDTSMDTTSAQVPKWMRRHTATDTDHGERSWKKGRSDGEGGNGTNAPAAASASQGASGGATDGHSQGGAGGAGSTDGAGVSKAAEGEDEALAARKEEVLRQATVDGVAIDHEAIKAMGRGELEAWAKHNLL